MSTKRITIISNSVEPSHSKDLDGMLCYEIKAMHANQSQHDRLGRSSIANSFPHDLFNLRIRKRFKLPVISFSFVALNKMIQLLNGEIQ